MPKKRVFSRLSKVDLEKVNGELRETPPKKKRLNYETPKISAAIAAAFVSPSKYSGRFFVLLLSLFSPPNCCCVVFSFLALHQRSYTKIMKTLSGRRGKVLSLSNGGECLWRFFVCMEMIRVVREKY